MGRPLKPIDPKQVEQLAAIDCTLEEIASVVGCSVDTLSRRFAGVIQRGRENGKASLKRMMWKAASSGNVAMQIWLSKNRLGYRDKIDMDTRAANSGISAFDRVEIVELVEGEHHTVMVLPLSTGKYRAMSDATKGYLVMVEPYAIRGREEDQDAANSTPSYKVKDGVKSKGAGKR